MLFTASPLLRVKIGGSLTKFYGSKDVPYVAAHIRLGGLAGELSLSVNLENKQVLLPTSSAFVAQHAVHVRSSVHCSYFIRRF